MDTIYYHFSFIYFFVLVYNGIVIPLLKHYPDVFYTSNHRGVSVGHLLASLNHHMMVAYHSDSDSSDSYSDTDSHSDIEVGNSRRIFLMDWWLSANQMIYWLVYLIWHGMKRSWNSTEGGSATVGVSVLVTIR